MLAVIWQMAELNDGDFRHKRNQLSGKVVRGKGGKTDDQ
jgi:hypothetical protein